MTPNLDDLLPSKPSLGSLSGMESRDLPPRMCDGGYKSSYNPYGGGVVGYKQPSQPYVMGSISPSWNQLKHYILTAGKPSTTSPRSSNSKATLKGLWAEVSHETSFTWPRPRFTPNSWWSQGPRGPAGSLTLHIPGPRSHPDPPNTALATPGNTLLFSLP